MSDHIHTEQLQATLRFDRGSLVVSGLTRGDAKATFPADLGTWDYRVKGWRTDAMYLGAVREWLEERGVPVTDEIPAGMTLPQEYAALPTLRPEQEQAVAEWRKSGQGVVVMPTGTGKTEVALRIIHDLGRSALIIAPVRDLMYQWHHRIQQRLGIDAGIIGDSIHIVKSLSVTTYDSACIYMEKYGAHFDLLVFDECHHLPGPTRQDAARMSVAPYRLGLTATLERSDGRHIHLETLIGPVVYTLPLEEVRGRTLADFEPIRIAVHLTEQEQQRYSELSGRIREHMAMKVQETPTYSWNEVCAEASRDPEARRILQAKRLKDQIEDRADEKLKTLEDLFRLHAEDRVLVFTGSNHMAREVSRRFLIPCLLHHCGKKERMEMLDGFREGRYRAIVANQVLDEGVDIPAAKVGVVIGGSASSKQAVQRLGRILRKQGDQRATLYEVICEDTAEVRRSRQRRKSDAYKRTRYRRA